ncbi:VOC family protein [Paenibacillus lemnae]|uniref:VOC family protein n=1 Tax=Paenibacillus lemnae TaxID=1330551 RepID=A0A848M7A1_PAELE|nr:VOC family protein [Paenibacillus lemnae]NMO97068.1 VOC family protein [Paenibacillus lemnae]
MGIIPYLNFKGNSRQAIEFYTEVFNLETPQIMTFGALPPNPEHPIPEEASEWVMHAMITIKKSPIMFSDVLPHMPFNMGNNFSLMVHSDDEAEIRTWFNRLQEGGTVNMDLHETFWSKLYGSVTDKFGIEWQVNLDNRQP